jgi:hypothetical protein
MTKRDPAYARGYGAAGENEGPAYAQGYGVADESK